MDRRELIAKDLIRAEIPRLYWESAVSRVPEKYDYRSKLVGYLESMAKVKEKLGYVPGLYLWSEKNGTGKTFIACAVLKEMLRRGNTGLFVTVSGYKEALTGQGEEFDYKYSYEDRAKDVDCLVLDDFGKEYRTQTGFAENKLEELIRHRVQNLKVTIITTNLSPAMLKEEYSADMADVCKEGFLILEIYGKNWRNDKEDQIERLLRGE